jgi:hypothetical protein
VIEVDGVPRAFPDGVQVTDPGYLGTFKALWHTLPCQLLPTALFKRLAEAVKQETAGKPHFDVTIYENIGVLRVTANIKLHGIPKALSVTLIDYAQERRHGNGQIPTIVGKTLDDLEANVSKWIGGHRDLIKAVHTPKECPCCGTKTKKGSALVLPAKW